MHRLRPIAASALLAVALAAVAAPAASAASASTIYPPSGSCTATPTTTSPGGTVAFACTPETFSSDERVTITVTGENGATAAIGMIRFDITTASGSAQSTLDGALESLPITLPANASGVYNIAAISATSAGGTAAVSVVAADGSLPRSGIDAAALIWLLVGGGALVLLGGAVAVVAAVRRRRSP